jgi:prephenate dehydratase
MAKIGFLGPPGTFTEQAALDYSPTSSLESFPSIYSVASAVSSGSVEFGVVPIENSLEGSVTSTLDVLISDEQIFIYNELVVRIEHCMMVKPGTQPEDVQVIYSHPQALGQCREFLGKSFPNAQLEASLSTAAAVMDMINSGYGSASIGSARCAELNKVEILAKNIQDHSANMTRFVALASKDHKPMGDDKTSLCFSFEEDKPGLLHKIMGEFSNRGINLAKVESRPTKRSLGSYIFLIDLHGHREDSGVKDALDIIRSETSMMRIFGSYPRWMG